MYVNQTLKDCLIKFLAETEFNEEEFKAIRKKFISVYPKFSGKEFYSKTYQIFRKVQESGFVSMDDSDFIYKYTSLCNRNELLKYSTDAESLTIHDHLYGEYKRLEDELKGIKLEIDILLKYMRLYPVIVDKISKCISDAKNNIKRLQSEISVLDKLLNCISVS